MYALVKMVEGGVGESVREISNASKVPSNVAVPKSVVGRFTYILWHTRWISISNASLYGSSWRNCSLRFASIMCGLPIDALCLELIDYVSIALWCWSIREYLSET